MLPITSHAFPFSNRHKHDALLLNTVSLRLKRLIRTEFLFRDARRTEMVLWSVSPEYLDNFISATFSEEQMTNNLLLVRFCGDERVTSNTSDG